MKLEDFYGGEPRVAMGTVAVRWGARTDDHWYWVDATVDQEACQAAPTWMDWQFAGAGGLVAANVRAGVTRALARLGCSVVDLVLVETDRAAYDRAVDQARG